MAQFTVNAPRFDPYKNFKFRLKWDGRYVAGVSKCSPLKRTTESVEHPEGGDPSTPRKSPGWTTFEGVTLERGSRTTWSSSSGIGRGRRRSSGCSSSGSAVRG
jgi:phage tail-like protein